MLNVYLVKTLKLLVVIAGISLSSMALFAHGASALTDIPIATVMAPVKRASTPSVPSITWQNSEEGPVYGMSLSSGSIVSQGVVYEELDTNWIIVGKGDFNGAGTLDHVWRNSSTGQVYLMFMQSPTQISGGALIHTEPDTAWRIVATGDVNGDGTTDLIWWNNKTGAVYGMFISGGAVSGGGLIHTEPNVTDWRIVACADFDGDGKADLLWWNSKSGTLYQMLIDGIAIKSQSVVHVEPDINWRIAGTGDLNGDGKADIIWHNRTTGMVYGMLMNGRAVTAQGLIHIEPDISWQIVSIADLNGDGKADLLWRNWSTGMVYLMPMNGLSIAGGAVLHTEPDTTYWRIMGETEWRDRVYGAGVTTSTTTADSNYSVLSAQPGPSRSVQQNSSVTLDGSRSTGAIVSYKWQQTGGPAVPLTGTSSARASFTAPPVTDPEGTAFSFSLTVADAAGASDTATITVTVTIDQPPPATTSIGLIEGAYNQGTIDFETSLIYKAFAIFGDNRLPTQYKGASAPTASRLRGDISRRYRDLTAESRSVIRPFLLRPTAPGSWYEIISAQAAALPASASGNMVNRAAAGPVTWSRFRSPITKFTVWAPSDNPTALSLAQDLANTAETYIYANLKALFKRDLPSDMGTSSSGRPDRLTNDGGDGSYDIYLVNEFFDGHGNPLTSMQGGTTPINLGITRASFIELRVNSTSQLGSNTAPPGGLGILQPLAHEMTHAFQFTYPKLNNNESEYDWLSESTANWAMDYLYPAAKKELDMTEKNSFDMLWSPGASLNDNNPAHYYTAYLPFTFLTRHKMPETDIDIIRRIYENARTMKSLEALNKETNKTTKYQGWWNDYLVAAWNGGGDATVTYDAYTPILFPFRTGDKLINMINGVPTSEQLYARPVKTKVRMNGASDIFYYLNDDYPKPQASLAAPAYLEPRDITAAQNGTYDNRTIERKQLAGRYYHFVFDDSKTQDARMVTLFDGWKNKLAKSSCTFNGRSTNTCYNSQPQYPPTDGKELRVLVKIEGKWSEVPSASVVFGTGLNYCRDKKSERLEEMVVILGNGSIDENTPLKSLGITPVVRVSNAGCWQWSGTVQVTQTNPDPNVQETLKTTVTFERNPASSFGGLQADLGYYLKNINLYWDYRKSGMKRPLTDQPCEYTGGDGFNLNYSPSPSAPSPYGTLKMPIQALIGGFDVRGVSVTGSGKMATLSTTCGEAVPPTYSWYWFKNSSSYPSAMDTSGTVWSGSYDDKTSNRTYTWTFNAVREF
ncbi:MAG: FG-GAP-like repeat-containing protein [Desulfuromonadales bacterium]